MRGIVSQDGPRTPAILLRSSPHKVGSAETPWLDDVNPDAGYALYFGDNKEEGRNPTSTPGNRALLRELVKHRNAIAGP